MNMKKSLIIGGLTLALAGGGFLYQSTASADQTKLAEQAEITEEEAKKTALDRVSGEVVETELEKENKKIVYEFEIKTDSGLKEVVVDAMTGEILEVEDEENEKEDDDDENESEEEDDK